MDVVWLWWLLLRTGAFQLRRRRQRIIWLLLRWVLQKSRHSGITQYSIHVIPSVSRSRPCCEGVIVGYVDDCDSPLLCLWRVLWPSLLVVALACHFDCSCSMRDGVGRSVKGAGEVLDFWRGCGVTNEDVEQRTAEGPRREAVSAKLIQEEETSLRQADGIAFCF